jgi:hypothetical protein
LRVEVYRARSWFGYVGGLQEYFNSGSEAGRGDGALFGPVGMVNRKMTPSWAIVLLFCHKRDGIGRKDGLFKATALIFITGGKSNCGSSL